MNTLSVLTEAERLEIANAAIETLTEELDRVRADNGRLQRIIDIKQELIEMQAARIEHLVKRITP